jgi:hypothetical protein
MCADRIEDTKHVLSVVAEGKGPRRGQVGQFSKVLSELKEKGTPAVVGIAERVLEKVGGPEKLADMMIEDLNKIRGADLTPALRQLHEPDYKVLKGMYDLLLKISERRDDMIAQHNEDPLGELSEEELMALMAEGCHFRLQVDEEFRRDILSQIQQVDPKLIEQYYLSSIGVGVVQ